MADQERGSQSQRAERLSQRRSMNTADPGGRTLIREDGGVDLAVEVVAAWSSPYFVFGFDEVTLFVDFTKGNANGFSLAAQASHEGDGVSGNWFDVHEDAGAGVLVRKVWSLSPAGSIRVAFTIRVSHPYVRFKLWGDGADLTNSRASVHATRHMLSS